MRAVFENGWIVVERVIETGVCESLREIGQGTHIRGGGVYGKRDALDDPRVVALAEDPRMRRLAEDALGGPAVAVRGIWFDKPDEANWSVPWHQDVTIALADRLDVDGFGPWTQKEGNWHAQAPATLLERMISLRLHLDPCGLEDGSLRVLTGSHRSGRGPAEGPEEAILAEIGDVALMRPLLWHASSPRVGSGHRRVVHLDYALSDALPEALSWRWKV